MKPLKYFLTLLIAGGFFISCGGGEDTQQITGASLLENTSQRSMAVSYDAAENIETFSAEEIDPSALEPILVKSREALSQSDREQVQQIMHQLIMAENIHAKLDVELMMSSEEVENGIFVFSINTPKSQTLAIQLYDEEGFEIAANNKIALREGTNYKALNVKSLDEGQYLFMLKDRAGRELMRKINITH